MFTETIEAATFDELQRKIADFMHDRLILNEEYFCSGIGYGVHLIYINL